VPEYAATRNAASNASSKKAADTQQGSSMLGLNRSNAPSPSPSPSLNSLETAVAVSVSGTAGDDASHDDDEQNSEPEGEAPDCPHSEIIAAYHAELPMLRRVAVWNEQRQKYLRSRWREDPERQDVAWWKGFFTYIRKCPVLVGAVETKGAHQGWQADLEWIVRPSNFLKIIEGKYEERVANA
jgi:hypothetical protein